MYSGKGFFNSAIFKISSFTTILGDKEGDTKLLEQQNNSYIFMNLFLL